MTNSFVRKVTIVLVFMALIAGIIFVGAFASKSQEEVYAEDEYTIQVTVTSSSTSVYGYDMTYYDVTFGSKTGRINGSTGSVTISSTTDATSLSFATHVSVYDYVGSGSIGENQTITLRYDFNFYGTITYSAVRVKKDPTVTAPTAKSNLKYTGSAQALVNAGSTDGGTMQYKLDSGSYSTSIPTAINAGSYTVYYKVVGNDFYNDYAEHSVSVSIAKATASVTAPTAKSLTYTGSAQALVNAGSTNFDTIQYKLGSGSYSTTIPTATNAGSYTVYYKVDGTSNYNGYSEQSVNVTIAKKSFTPTVNITGWTYGDNANGPSVSGNTSGGAVTYTYATQGSSSYSATVPTNVGNYTVKATIAATTNYNEATATKNFSISKKSFTPTVNITGWTYGNSANSPSVSGNTSGGTVTYTYATQGSSSYSSTVPTNAGNYTVKATIAATSNYNEATATKNFSIAKANASINQAPTAKSGLIYSGSALAIINAGSANGGTMQYKVGSGSYSATIPTQANVGTYSIYYKVVGDANHNDLTEAGPIEVTIAKADITNITCVQDGQIYYNGSAQAPQLSTSAVTVNNQPITFTYSHSIDGPFAESVTFTEVSEYTAYYKVSAPNHNDATGSFSVVVFKGDPSITGLSRKEGLKYLGVNQYLITSGSTNGGTLQYKLGDGEYSTTIPSAKNVGSYTIYYKVVGNDSWNDVQEESLQVSIAKTDLEITAKDTVITYGDEPTNSGVNYSGFVNNETNDDLDGTLVFNYNYDQFGNVGVYTISILGYTSENYNISYVSGNLTVSPKDIEVTIVPKESPYGAEPVELEYYISSGEIVNGDTNVYTVTCSVTASSEVGTYDIVGTDTSDNYNVTFVGGENAYSVTQQQLRIIANPNTIIYGDAAIHNGVIFEGFVNGQTEADLGGSIAYAYNYNQFDNIGSYTITPSGYTSDDYHIVFVDGVLIVNPKALEVTITPKTSVYKEAIEELEYSLTSGEIVNGDTNIYSVTCNISSESNAGSYNISGVVNNSNYSVTFINTENGYVITKRPVVLQADDKVGKYGEALPQYTFTLSEEVESSSLEEIKNRVEFTSSAKNTIPGKYVINVTYKDGFNKDTVSTNYSVELKNAFITIEENEQKSEETKKKEESVDVQFEGVDNPFDYDVKVFAEIRSSEASSDAGISYKTIEEKYVDSRSEINTIYSVKLLKVVDADGVEIYDVIDENDIKDGLIFAVKMPVPDDLEGRNFKILQISNDKEAKYVDSSNVDIEDGFAVVKTGSLDDLAFVSLKPNEEMDHLSFCMGCPLLIFDGIMLALLIVYIATKKKKILGLIGMIASGSMVAYGIVVLFMHVCYITIAALGIDVLIFMAFLILFLTKYFKDKKKAPKEEINKTIEEVSKKQEKEVDINQENDNDEKHGTISLKDSMDLAKATASSHKFNKAYICNYLKGREDIELSTRENYTKTGLPLADTHYVIKDGKRICFAYVYETEGSIILLAKMDSDYANKLKQKHENINLSAFPKQKNTWYSLIIDDTYTKEEFEQILDDITK